MEGVVENPPHPAPPADKKTTPIGIFLYIVAFWWLKNGNLSGYGRPASERGAFIPTLEKKMKKKALTLAIAAALSAPASFAAQDDSGMRYTSASEGFYASIRVVYDTKSTKSGKGGFGNDGSRVGIRGTNDMGGGLEGFYRWESEVSIRDGDKSNETNTIRARLGNVGVRGAFGQVQLGSFWTADLNWVGAPIDRAGTTEAGGYYATERKGRSQNAIEYTTPDLNGFAGAVRVSTERAAGASGTVGRWNLASKYETHGFKIAASYNVIKDGFAASTGAIRAGTGADTSGANAAMTADAKVGDTKSWSTSLAYAQDNWDVGMVYGVDNTSDDGTGVAAGVRKGGGCGTAADVRDTTTPANNRNGKKCEDRKILAIAGGLSLDKVRLLAAWEKIEQPDGSEDVDGGVEAQYRFTSNSQAWIRYALRDFDSNPARENQVRVGLRHDF